MAEAPERSRTKVGRALAVHAAGWKYPAMRKNSPMKKASLTPKNRPIR
jgi:hypothetical protein